MKSASFYRRNDCRYCGSKNLELFLTLGDQPPSNSFIPVDKITSEEKYPLDVYVCKNCYLSQLIDVVSARIIFDDYLYLSSSSRALREHYETLAKNLEKQFSLKKGSIVVDVGCNDGVLLRGYSEKLIRIGVEPSKVAKIAKKEGFVVYQNFFNKITAQKIVKENGKADVVTATNVFAHVDNIAAFVEGLPILLSKKGVFIIETPYLIDMFEGLYFDTIYHEHLCYLSITPMAPFLQRFGLEIFDVQRIPFGASGPAIRVFVGKTGERVINKHVKERLSHEDEWGIKKLTQYKNYAKKVEGVKATVINKIKKIKQDGKRVGAYGAPAKGNTLLNYFEITPDLIDSIAETNPLKQGLVTPGSHIPIVSEEKFLQLMPEFALLLTWNYLDFFLGKSDYIKKGGKFIVPLPSPKIVP